MSINPVSSSAFRNSANYSRGSNDAQQSKSPLDNRLNGDSGNRKSGVSDRSFSDRGAGQGTDQEAGQGAGGFQDSLPKFARMEDVLARFDAAKSDAAGSDEQLQQTMEGFQNQFANSAKDADAFHSLMQTAFGDKYNKQEAENIRQQTLAGDFSWMPNVEVVKGSTLSDTSGAQGSGVALGAYDSASDTIYLSEELLAGDPQQAVDILTEEVGHAIDTRLNTSDSTGDEGELFAKLVGGENLSDAQIQAIRSENDHGSIENVVEPIVDNVVKPVAGLVSGAASAVGNAVSSVGNAISSGITSLGGYLTDGVISVADHVTDGLDFLNDNIVSPILDNIPIVGPWLNDHIVQPGFGALETGVSVVSNLVIAPIELTTHALSGAAEITTNLLTGDFSGAWDSLVETGEELLDSAVTSTLTTGALLLNGVTTWIDDTFNLSETRGLTPREQAYLETIYGDSLDYDEIEIQMGSGIEGMLGFDTPNAMENTIFMPDGNYDENGELTDAGMDLLAHEAAHVWQFQNDGPGYIGDAIGSYIQSGVEQGNIDGAYDFATAINELKPWGEMTPDEQAEIAMVIGEANENFIEALERQGLNINDLSDEELIDQYRPHLEAAIDAHNDNDSLPDLSPTNDDISLSDDQVSYLLNIHNILLNGG